MSITKELSEKEFYLMI